MKNFFCINKKRVKLPAFSLTELLVVLVIIGILVLLALPVLMPLISKAKSTEAQIQLNHLYTLEKSYFYMYSKYSASFDDIGYEHAKSVTGGGNANYKIEIVEASPNTFKAKATAIVDFDGDGAFNVWEIDNEQKLVEITKD
ncbi:MAG: type II secretion system protein [Bacteroidia bacterium]|nr:type II secretion system protein [Bacteroidia bacterium]